MNDIDNFKIDGTFLLRFFKGLRVKLMQKIIL